MKYASWAPLLECEAVVTSITPKETRVVADCGKNTNSDSAMSRTQDSLRAPMFEEHIAATLKKRAFNRSNVDAKEVAAVFMNLGGMQREALEMAAEDARQSAAARRR
jgi:3-dehydroquinate dehydratase